MCNVSVLLICGLKCFLFKIPLGQITFCLIYSSTHLDQNLFFKEKMAIYGRNKYISRKTGLQIDRLTDCSGLPLAVPSQCPFMLCECINPGHRFDSFEMITADDAAKL